MGVLLANCCDECKDDPCDPCTSDHPCPRGTGNCCPAPDVFNLTVHFAGITNFGQYTQGVAYKIGNRYYMPQGSVSWSNLEYYEPQTPACCIDGRPVLEEGATLIDGLGQKCPQARGWRYTTMKSSPHESANADDEFLNVGDGGFMHFFAQVDNYCGCNYGFNNSALANSTLGYDTYDQLDRNGQIRVTKCVGTSQHPDTGAIIVEEEDDILTGAQWREDGFTHVYIQ